MSFAFLYFCISYMSLLSAPRAPPKTPTSNVEPLPVSTNHSPSTALDQHSPSPHLTLLTKKTNHPLPQPDKVQLAIRQNKEWAEKTATTHPQLFPRLAAGQSPEILWIGCSDSRVPETTIMGLQPGDVFVHRNIANVIHAGDLSAGAVVEYAVVYLKVKHIVVCGHTSCGGVAAALGNSKLGLLDAWLAPLRSLRRQHLRALKGMEAPDAARRLVELNVLRGVETLRENGAVIDGMRERGLKLYAMVYDIASGELQELGAEEGEGEGHARKEACETWHAGKEPGKEEGQKK